MWLNRKFVYIFYSFDAWVNNFKYERFLQCFLFFLLWRPHSRPTVVVDHSSRPKPHSTPSFPKTLHTRSSFLSVSLFLSLSFLCSFPKPIFPSFVGVFRCRRLCVVLCCFLHYKTKREVAKTDFSRFWLFPSIEKEWEIELMTGDAMKSFASGSKFSRWFPVRRLNAK